ncbi:MAG: hypothetical protein AVDCRST_MAG11-2490, partial [uncultured Gemmatimonadaceae bacterium]
AARIRPRPRRPRDGRRHPRPPARLGAPARLAVGGRGALGGAPPLPGGGRRARPLARARLRPRPGARGVARRRGAPPRAPQPPVDPDHLPLLVGAERGAPRARLPAPLARGADRGGAPRRERARGDALLRAAPAHDRVDARLRALRGRDPRRSLAAHRVGHAGRPLLATRLGVGDAARRDPRRLPPRPDADGRAPRVAGRPVDPHGRERPVAARRHRLRGAVRRSAAGHRHAADLARLPRVPRRARPGARPRPRRRPRRALPHRVGAAARARPGGGEHAHGDGRERLDALADGHAQHRGGAAAVGARRRLRGALAARRRDLRLGVAGARPHARARGRPQDAPPAGGRRRGRGAPVPTRGAARRPARPPGDRPDLRLGQQRRRRLVHDGAGRGRVARRARAPRGPAPARRRRRAGGAAARWA